MAKRVPKEQMSLFFEEPAPDPTPAPVIAAGPNLQAILEQARLTLPSTHFAYQYAQRGHICATCAPMFDPAYQPPNVVRGFRRV